LSVLVDLAVDAHHKARRLQVCKMLLEVGRGAACADGVFWLGRSLEHGGSLVGSQAKRIQAGSMAGNRRPLPTGMLRCSAERFEDHDSHLDPGRSKEWRTWRLSRGLDVAHQPLRTWCGPDFTLREDAACRRRSNK